MVYSKVVEGSFTTHRFLSFLEGLLDRMDMDMDPGAYIIMDNARIHHNESIRDLIEGRGYHIMYLPPYSPDFNPMIELAFSSIKTKLMCAGQVFLDGIMKTMMILMLIYILHKPHSPFPQRVPKGGFIIVSISR